MKPENFCYWLQGFFEISEGNQLTEKQTEIIKRHLELVFFNVTNNQSANTKEVSINSLIIPRENVALTC